jgi:hypothetical protein
VRGEAKTEQWFKAGYPASSAISCGAAIPAAGYGGVTPPGRMTNPGRNARGTRRRGRRRYPILPDTFNEETAGYTTKAERARPRAQQRGRANKLWKTWSRRDSPSLLRPRTGALLCRLSATLAVIAFVPGSHSRPRSCFRDVPAAKDLFTKLTQAFSPRMAQNTINPNQAQSRSIKVNQGE